ncbi:glycosyltransferase family 4 protein [Desulfosporosinus nitroreducens]|uniref:glycosyltransferase family 4 protein n=1 Tax=Desulfosporosinus nitroreducens TaxID=2018668 RepID=UPI00207C9385|nr:glycosyltransferase family 4 protein [Desulfosporosinus nitroreducens]MCO1604115.1 glycosyltransferase family 4 protein [Desulfosporosinus nitroreducens]
MKILTLTNEFEDESFGGAGTAVTGMVHVLDRMGVQQTVIVPRSDWNMPRWALLGQQIKVLWLPRNSHYFGYLGMIKADVVCQEFPEICQGWDIIHSHAINFTPLAYTLSQEVVPILYSVYSFLRKELGDSPESELQAQFKIQEELFMRCQRIQLISQSERHYLANYLPQYLAKTEVLPLGITIPLERWRPGSINELLYVGRLIDYKGIEDLIKAISIRQRSGRKILLNIVGKGTDSYESYLKQLVKSLKLEAYIHFHGRTPSLEVRRWMASSTALVVPSRREAYGLVALEGMAIGTPIIASNAGGLAEVVPNACALTFEAGNVAQLSEALANLIDTPSLQKSLSIKGRENALRFKWSQLAPRYLALLERVKGK